MSLSPVLSGWMYTPSRRRSVLPIPSFDHPEHGYTLLGRQPGHDRPADAIQERAFDLYMSFFAEHLKADQGSEPGYLTGRSRR